MLLKSYTMQRYIFLGLCFLIFGAKLKAQTPKAVEFLQKAKKAYERKALEETKNYLDSALLADKTYAQAYARRGLLRYELADMDKALIDYNQAMRLVKQQKNKDEQFLAQLYYQRGAAYHQKLMNKQAFHDFSKALKLNPKYTQAYVARGVLKEDKNNFKGALKDYSKAIEVDMNFAMAYYNRGLVYYNLGKVSKALADWQKALDINEKYVDVYLARAFAYQQREDDVLALQDYNQAIKYNEYSAEAYLNRGMVYLKLGKKNKACEDWAQSVKVGGVEAQKYLDKYCK